MIPQTVPIELKGSDLIGVAPVASTTGVIYPSGGFTYKGNVTEKSKGERYKKEKYLNRYNENNN
jgi:hypothetical protein